MKNSELIEELSKLNPDKEVTFWFETDQMEFSVGQAKEEEKEIIIS